ncbi:DNA-binding LytR/AlgR family response regulator [Paenibacillus turicensis]|uniref:DNA-binding LytR/AlgR family response regulator n=1 Tax=Paenibacillus turicensis TaxID=160487 RepID=A0ABS4FWU3_9BACL|nr:LytTR family transcriptional regulator DNA-binding domain-containing protein [Paenibacillus turicensis]MBP1907052.1 DNA-binding LytR/AlgR family response regulator [Paenibacillus turicensis]
MFLAVSKDITGSRGLTLISIEDVLYISFAKNKRRVAIHLACGVCYVTGTVAYWEYVLNNTGFCFITASKGVAINAANVIAVSKLYKKVIFEDSAIEIQISRDRYEEVCEKLTICNDNIYFL